MKKRLFKSLLFVISLLFSLTACNGIFQQKASSDEKVVLSISVKSNVNGTELNLNSRTASVSAADELAYYKSLVYTLTAVDSDSNQVTLLESYSYDDFIEATPEIDPGEWTFTLEAVDSETKTSVLTGSCAKSISTDDSFVSFTLQAVENLTGTIELKIVYASDYVTKNESGEAVYPDFSLVIHQAKYTDGSFPVEDYEFKCTSEGNSESDGLYSNTYEASYPVGKCLVYAFYNDNLVYSDLFYVSPNLTTSAEFTTGDAVKAVTTYTYHQGNLTFTDYCKTGSEYTLSDNQKLNQFYCRYFEGWYDNPEFTGDAVTSVTAGDDEDFYAKYGLYIRNFGEVLDLNYSSDIKFDEIWADPVIPVADEWYEVTLSGTLQKKDDETLVAVEEKVPVNFYLYTDEIEDSVWNLIVESAGYYFEPDSDGKFTLTTKVLVPSDFAYTTSEHLGITYGFSDEQYTNEIYVTDFEVSAKVEKVTENTTADGLVVLSTCEDGVKFVIDYTSVFESYPDDAVNYVEITEESTETHYGISSDSINALNTDKKLELVFPLLQPDKLYKFFVNIQTNDGHGTFCQNVPCVSGSASLGELDYTGYSDLSTEMTEDDDGRYIKINKFYDYDYATLFSGLKDFDTSAVQIDYDLWAGDKLWNNNSTVWTDGDETLLSESSLVKLASSDTGANYLADDCFGNTKSFAQINEVLAEHGQAWFEFRLRFPVSGYTAGDFTTKSVASDVTTYTKFEKEYTVTFDKNDGSESTPDTQSVVFGGTVTEPAAPVRTGYTFNGWLLNGKAYDFTAVVMGDVTLTASWTVNKRTLILIINSDAVTTKTIEADYGSNWEYTCSEEDVAKAGYDFLGFATEENATERDYSSPFSIEVPDENMTLYAVWRKKSDSGISVTWEIPAGNDLTLTYDSEKNTITASEDYDSYAWYVDDVEEALDETTNVYTLNLDDLGEGYHYFKCIGTKSTTAEDGTTTTTTADGYITVLVLK